MMMLIETWKPCIDCRTIFSYNDILNIRILYANKLYFYPKNDADLSLVTDFYSLVNVCLFVLLLVVAFLYLFVWHKVNGDYRV